MASINQRGGAGNNKKVGTALQLASPLLSLIPVAGPALATAASVGGGLINGSGGGSVQGIQSQKRELAAPAAPQTPPAPDGASPSPMQRRFDQIAPGQVKQLEDSIVAARSMNPQLRQQTEPLLMSAYEEAMRRRGGLA